MAITVQITTTNYVVTATEVSSNITIIADSSTFTVTNQVSNFTITNVQPTITFTTDGTNGFDFATKFRGEWVYGETYLRNDCVTYQENFYVCKIAATTTLVSTIPPPDDPTNWTEVIDIRNITTASIQDLTVANMTVTNTFKLGPLYYSNTAGLYGQVLFTDGSSYANWTNLGDLVLWSLSEDLKTNGFGIKTNTATNLKIGSYDAAVNYSYINFKPNGIDYYSTTGNHSFYTAGNMALNPVSLSANTLALNGRSLQVGDANIEGNLYLTGLASGTAAVDPFKVGSGGIRFTDGSVINSAGTGSFNLTQIASTSTLGVIRVGGGLTINTSTGVLTVDFQPGYELPAASPINRGGIKIGNGLEFSGPVNFTITNFTTSTTATDVTVIGDIKNGVQVGEIITIIHPTGGYNPFSVYRGIPFFTSPLSTTTVGLYEDAALTIPYVRPWYNGPITSFTSGTVRWYSTDVLNVSTTTEFGNVSLTQDMFTNGFNIRSQSGPSTILSLDVGQFTISDSYGNGITGGSGIEIGVAAPSFAPLLLQNDAGDITLNTPRHIFLTANTSSLTSNLVKIGRSANTSTLHVQKIYNYAGSYAPEFPAGIQFGDGSVQVTAWQTSTLYQSALVVDFDNPFDP